MLDTFPSNQEPIPFYLVQLREMIAEYFDLEELKTLSFDLQIDFDNLAGQEKVAKTRELISYMERHKRLNDLLAELTKARPGISWPGFSERHLQNPYRGLDAFRESDASFFFGRETFVQQLITNVQQKNLIAVIGPSGSGKSSVLFAGLLPYLRQEGNWLVVSFRPGKRPFLSLASALVALLETDIGETDLLIKASSLAETLQGGKVALGAVLDRILQKQTTSCHLLLLADQFEELWSLCAEDTRHAFLDIFLQTTNETNHMATRDRMMVKLVFTLRADFLGQVLTYRPLADALQDGDVKLGPMSREEMYQAIQRPAEIMGVRFETGLVERMLDDILLAGGQPKPGILPLLEFALTLLWEWQKDRELTHVAYEIIGQVKGALVQYAEKVYKELPAAERSQLPSLLIQLVQPGVTTEDTRRLAKRDELTEEQWRLAQHLSEARLIITSRDEAGQETAEFVHEALIQRWQRLQDWMRDERTFRLWQERLRAAMLQWTASEQDSGALLRGAPLIEAQEWLNKRKDDLSQHEQAFITSSIRLRDAELAERKAQELRELETAQQLAEIRQRRVETARRALIFVLFFLFIAIGAAIYGFIQNANAQNQLALSNSRALASASQNVGASDPTLALLLAIESGKTADTPQAFNALRPAIVAPGQLLFTFHHQDPLSHAEWDTSATWNQDKNQILTTQGGNTARVWDAETGKSLLNLEHEAKVDQASWSPGGNYILTVSTYRTARVWDAATGARLEILTHAGEVHQASWGQDDSQIMTVGPEGVKVWDTATDTERFTLPVTDNVGGAMWGTSEDQLLTIHNDGTARMWEVATSAELFTLSHNSFIMPIWNNGLIATIYEDRNNSEFQIIVADARTGIRLSTLTHEGQITNVNWNEDGSLILTSNRDGLTKAWDVRTGEEKSAVKHLDSVNAYWMKQGNHFYTVSWDNTARIWSMTESNIYNTFTVVDVDRVFWNEDETRFVTIKCNRVSGAGGYCLSSTMKVWDLTPEVSIQALLPPYIETPLPQPNPAWNNAIWAMDGSRLLTFGDDGTFQMWDLTIGGEQLTLISDEFIVNWDENFENIVTDNYEGFKVWNTAIGTKDLILPHEGWRGVAVWNHAKSQIMTTGLDGTAKVWDAETGTLLLSIPHNDGIDFVSWNRDENLILTAGFNGGVSKVWDANTGEELYALSPDATLYQVKWNKDGTRILATESAAASVWNAQTGTRLFTLPHQDFIRVAEWNKDETRILTASQDGMAKVWDAESGRPIVELSHGSNIQEARWSSDEKQIFTLSYDEAVEGMTAKVWNSGTGSELFTLDQTGLSKAVLNENGDRILTAANDGTITIWDFATGEKLLSWSHGAPVEQMIWQGDKVITANNIAKVWDATTGAELFTLPGDGTPITLVELSHNQRLILLTTEGGMTRIYYTSMSDLIASACDRVARNFTLTEWQLYFPGEAYRQTCLNLPIHSSVQQ
jgi:WD40 repeat protein